MTDQRTAVIQEWMQARENASKWAQRERELRDFIAKAAFGYDPAVGGIEGTFRQELGNGYNLKLVAPVTYTLKDGAEVRAALEFMRNMAQPLPKPLIAWQPKLSVTAYKVAPEELRKIIAPALTTKPGAPQLEIEAPKA